MTSRWCEERAAVARIGRTMSEMGLAVGTSGNVSVRLPLDDSGLPLMAITPSGIPYPGLRGQDIVVTDFEIEPLEGDLLPSSESMLHVAIYQARRDISAVVHTHAVYSSVLAVTGMDVPPILDEALVHIGGSILVSEYGFPGSEELARNVTEALGDRKAAIIANHGAVGVGKDLEEALEICALVERVSEIFVHANTMGRIIQLSPEVIEAEQAIYRMRNPGIDNMESPS